MDSRIPALLVAATLLCACSGGSTSGASAGAGTTGSAGGTTTGAAGGGTTGSQGGGTTGTAGGGTTGSIGGGTTGATTGTTTGSTGGGGSGGGTTGSTSGGAIGSTGGGTTGTTGGGTTGTTGGATTGSTGGLSPAATLARKLGRANHLLVGLGSYNETPEILSQGLHPDFYDRYLTDNSGGSWINYNSPPGAYVDIVAAAADSVGAVPMFTLYQMAVNGEGNLATLRDQNLMTTYWQHAILLFQRIAVYGKPALVNFEPDFWGFTEQQATNNDPTTIFAYVNITADCAALPNNVAGVGKCLLKLARTYAPKAYVGFPPSNFGNTDAQIVAFMNAVGAAGADFMVMQTLDRDAGCFEAIPAPPDCQRNQPNVYWDESNNTHPNFADHFAEAHTWQSGIGNLPILWWQTPQGVPSLTPGGTQNHYRDNRTHYFLTHPAELTAIGGLGIVFGAGANTQTTIQFDGGQYQMLVNAYLANPAPLP